MEPDPGEMFALVAAMEITCAGCDARPKHINQAWQCSRCDCVWVDWAWYEQANKTLAVGQKPRWYVDLEEEFGKNFRFRIPRMVHVVRE